MKEILVQQIQPVIDGPVYGKVSNPADFVKSQQYAHEHIDAIVRDYLSSGCGEEPQIAGFEYTLTGGLNIRIFAPGHVVDVLGRSFDLIGASQVDLALAEADATNSRIDLVYAKLEVRAEAESEERPFVRLRTQEELEAGVAPYPPQQFTEPTELHTRAVVMLRTGTPDAQPQTPAINSDEVPLYEVHVSPNAAALTTSDVFDAREQIRSLRCAWTQIDLLLALVNELQRADHSHPARKIFIEGVGPYAGKNVQDFIDDLAARSDTEFFDPLIQPELLTPELAPSHDNAGTLVSVGDVDSGTPIVDFPVGREIVFSNASYKITEERFPTGVNARVVNKHVSAGTDTDTKQTNFSLATISGIESDGGGDFDQESYELPAGRTKSYHGGRMVAARDGQFLEVFGGAYPNGSNSWFTIDTVGGTVTQRNFTGDVPTFAIIFAAPCGNGNVLIAERGGANFTTAGSTLRWYVVNATTGAATRLASGPGVEPAPSELHHPGVVGDLVQENLIVVAVAAHGIATISYYAFDVLTGTFDTITTVGQGPTPYAGVEPQRLRDIDACFLQQGKLLFVEAHSQVRSFIFDYPTRSFTRLQISQPVAQVNSGVKGISLANMQGRPYLMGEFFSVWELTPGVAPKWAKLSTALDTGIGTRGIAGLAGLLADGLPKGRGYVVGGIVSQTGVARQVKRDVWEFQPAGIVDTVCDGQPAITLGGGATQASFSIPAYNVNFAGAVAKLLVNLRGHLPQGSIKLSYSFDGMNFQDVPREQITNILSSDNPAIRTVRITLVGVGSVKPCLIGMTERFERAGGPGFSQLVLRYDAVTAGVRGLYIDRFGVITIESAISETTANKALLHIVTPTGSSTAPTVKDIIQQRLVHRKFTGTHSGSNPVVVNRLPRRPRFVQALRFVAGAGNDLADPTIEFNNDIVVTGLSSGNTFRLEVQA